MTRLLLMEGNPAASRSRSAAHQLPSPSEIYGQAIREQFPEIEIDTYFGADEGEQLPRPLDAYDGFVVSGSSLHAYDQAFGVTNQIDMLRRVASAGLPILGSCWGLQIAAMAAGGMVGRNPARAEMGIARKIVPTLAGREHPMLRGRGAAFDAPCIHYDDVTQLPEGAQLLASNAHCPVQAAIIPLGRSEIWAVQYHPEFDLPHIADLLRYYSQDLVAGRFFHEAGEVGAYADRLNTIVTGSPQDGLAWQLGIDGDLIENHTRRLEIINWIEHAVGHRAKVAD